jgi:hypothetical protein
MSLLTLASSSSKAKNPSPRSSLQSVIRRSKRNPPRHCSPTKRHPTKQTKPAPPLLSYEASSQRSVRNPSPPLLPLKRHPEQSEGSLYLSLLVFPLIQQSEQNPSPPLLSTRRHPEQAKDPCICRCLFLLFSPKVPKKATSQVPKSPASGLISPRKNWASALRYALAPPA